MSLKHAMYECPVCRGEGSYLLNDWIACHRCEGTGMLRDDDTFIVECLADQVKGRTRQQKRRRLILWLWLIAAAAIILKLIITP